MIEPEVSERLWYRNAQTGDRGYLVVSGGRDCIRLNRPEEPPDRVLPFDPGLWEADLDVRPYTEAQVAQVAFEADKALCAMDGRHDLAKRSWLNMTPEKRLDFMATGPTGKIRAALFAAIMQTLKEHAR